MSEETVKTVVTKRDDTLRTSAHVETPAGLPDVRVVAMPWWQIVLVRGARVYVQTFSGVLAAGLSGADKGMLPDEFGLLLWTALGFGFAPAVMSVVMNVSELLARLDVTRPTMRA